MKIVIAMIVLAIPVLAAVRKSRRWVLMSLDGDVSWVRTRNGVREEVPADGQFRYLI